MARYVLRIWLPDRPGALGLVASRIGAVGGDIVAVDILGRGDGRAMDEFVIELAGEHLVELLGTEIHEVDGVTLEEVREVDPEPVLLEE
jgi:UTP:GlnB (protein PII) uridylyltransferase